MIRGPLKTTHLRCCPLAQDPHVRPSTLRSWSRRRLASGQFCRGPRKIWLLLLVLLLPGCGGTPLDQGEDYGNILSTPSGLVLTQAEHAPGWGIAECTMCHNLNNIHLVNRSGIAIDIDAIHNQALSDGISGCAACHGTNGL